MCGSAPESCSQGSDQAAVDATVASIGVSTRSLPDYAGTLPAIWFAMSTAEFLGSALHVLTSTMTLFLCTNDRPQAHPEDIAFC